MLIVGTSGWQYRDWRGPFYPGAPSLSFYAGHFGTVELNNSFYRLPSFDQFAKWRDETPDGFVFAVKMSRYLTHIKRLREPCEPVSRFLSAAAGLGDRLGPVLLQLPPTLKFDAGLLDEVLGLLPGQVAVEPRHRSWWCDEARELLEKHGAALCWADRLGRPVTPLWKTADFGYVRLHEGRARPRPRYGRAALRSWLARMSVFGDRPVYVYFNNDPGCAAVADAFALLKLAGGRAGARGGHAAGQAREEAVGEATAHPRRGAEARRPRPRGAALQRAAAGGRPRRDARGHETG